MIDPRETVHSAGINNLESRFACRPRVTESCIANDPSAARGGLKFGGFRRISGMRRDHSLCRKQEESDAGALRAHPSILVALSRDFKQMPRAIVRTAEGGTASPTPGVEHHQAGKTFS